MASCADEIDQKYIVEKPKDLAMYDYLNDYAPLKEYVDRAKLPNFKVGAALDAAEFNNGGLLSMVAKSNFDEIVAGNAMKMASVVNNEGNMDFGTVQAFVEAAEESGLTVFGHTLAWHSQQPTTWLNSLLADKPDPNWTGEPEGPEAVAFPEGTLYGIDYRKYGAFPFYVMGYTPDFSQGLMMTAKPTDAGWYQYFAADGIDTSAGEEYTVTVYAKASQSATFNVNMGWGWGEGEQASSQITIGTEWGEYSAKFTGVKGDKSNVVMQPGGNSASIDYAWLVVDKTSDAKSPYITANKGGYLKAGVVYPTYTAFENKLSKCDGTVESSNLIARVHGAGDVNAPIENGAYVVHATAKVADAWDNQFFITSEYKWTAGEKAYISFDYKATTDAKASTQCHAAPGGYIHWQAIGDVNFTTEWQTFTKEFTIPSECDGKDMQSIAFNLNEFEGANDYMFKNVVWSAGSERHTLVPNYGCEGDDMSGFIVKEDRGAVAEASAANLADDGKGGKCIVVHAGAMVEYAWDSQFWINTPIAVFDGGEKCKISFRYKADKPAKASTQCHADPGAYIHWQAIGDVNFTTEWQTFVWEGAIPAECAGKGMHTIAFNLNEFAEANNYYFDDIAWECEELTEEPEVPVAPFIPLTAEEKKDTLTWAMDKWINGMIKATNGKVKAWDLVNEAVSGGGNVGDGYYDLQTANGNDADFFWQDYLGNIDYVVIAEKAARKAYAEIEGTNPNDLKLFVNDYNLESTWDDLKKVKSYVKYWIPEWEKAGAKIDGIGSQMHVSYSENAEAQAWQENRIVEMFKIMASSGKLVRVSELDMCYKNANNEELEGELTYEQKQKLAEFYNFIVKAYMENVPAAQQYGITQWCITDAPAAKSWRHKTIGGLWSEDHNTRMPAYAGWAEGLQGKTYTSPVK